MPKTSGLQFGPFRVDLSAEQLWCDNEVVRLTPKAFAVLQYMVTHAGQLVRKEELVETIWGTAYVTEAVLTTCIREVRRALGERAQTPHFIETVRGRGYRFIAPVTDTTSVTAPSHAIRPPSVALSPSPVMVGREAEMALLHQRFAQACQGERQLVLITGEAGIGKTTLIDAFVEQIANPEMVWISYGHCIEQHGVGEPYLPLLAALGQLGRDLGGETLVAVLRQEAPSWLVQMPGLLSEAERETLQRVSGGMSQERMLREFAEAIEFLTVEQPLVLVLEDLHWSDGSTLDWLAYIARRRQRARLLVIGTYRSVDAIVRAHPVHQISQELRRQRQAEGVVLDYLSEPEVEVYLRHRLGNGVLQEGLARVLHQRTDGNPLFLVTLMDEVVRRGVIEQSAPGWELARAIEAIATEVPETVQQLIEQQLDHLPPEDQELLEVGSIEGAQFSATAVAVEGTQVVEEIEVRFDALARRGQFVRTLGLEDWPDGTVTARYGFIHALYRDVFYERVSASRRVRLHQQIGARLETGYGPHAQERAVELAEHFVRGRDTTRAVHYLCLAGENAIRRSAHQEAIPHLTEGLDRLRTMPDTPERARRELNLQMMLGPALIAIKGIGAEEVEQVYQRAYTLGQQLEDRSQLSQALWGLARFHFSNGTLQTGRELGEQLLALAQEQHDPNQLLSAHSTLGRTLCFMGEFTLARTHLEAGLEVSEHHWDGSMALQYSYEPRVQCLAFLSRTLWSLGYPSQSLQLSQEAYQAAQDLDHTVTLASTLWYVATVHQYRCEPGATAAVAETLLDLSAAYELRYWQAMGTFIKGWAIAATGNFDNGLHLMHQGLEMTGATGNRVARSTYLIQTAEVEMQAGLVAEGLDRVGQAIDLLEASDRKDGMADAYRVQGELLLRQSERDMDQAERCFHQALEIARRQEAKSWELRAATSLSRLWQQQGKHKEARELLAPVYQWFTEGFDTPDLQDAKSLLHELKA